MDVSRTWAEREAAEAASDRAWATFVDLGDDALLARLAREEGGLTPGGLARAGAAMAAITLAAEADERLARACDVTRAETVATLTRLGFLPREER